MGQATKWSVVGAAAVLMAILGCGSSASVTYHGEVAEVLSANCVACHTEGGIAPFQLDSPEWAVRMAPVIAHVVREGIMPPWPPGPESPPFQDERLLSPEDKDLLIAWAESGAPLGKPTGQQVGNQQQVLSEVEPDLVLALDPPYKPDVSKPDDYRCFLLDPQLQGDTFVDAYEVKPDLTALVHHSLLFIIGPRSVEEAESLDRSEAGPGWTCFGGPGITTDIAGLGLLGFWVPGAGATEFPGGTGKLLEAGSRIIIQLHYHVAQVKDTEPDATRVELSLADPTAKLKPVDDIPLAAPVEILCQGHYPSSPNDPCNREYALERSELRVVANGIHLLCGTRPGDYTSRDVGDGSSQENSCDQQVQEDGLALGVAGHMHLRGRSIKIALNPATPEARTLLHIPDWDFNWQGQYWFQEPVQLKSGDMLRITCTYDNSGPIPGPDGSPIQPRYMTWGEGTTDEMCLGALSFIES